MADDNTRFNDKNLPINCFFIGQEIVKETYEIIDYIKVKTNQNISFSKYHKVTWLREVVRDIQSTYGGYVFSGCNLVITDKFTPKNFIPNDTPPVRGDAFNENHIRPFEAEILTQKDQLNEYIMTKLRLDEGMNENDIRNTWGNDQLSRITNLINKFIQEEKVEKTQEGWRLTKDGKFFADGIASALFQV